MNEKLKKYLADKDFFKLDTAGAVQDVFDKLTSSGVKEDDALAWIDIIVCAIKNEYGE